MAEQEIDETPRTITEAGLANSSARIVPPRSVILSTRAPIGHLAINTVPMAFNQGCRGLVPNEELDHMFLYYFLYTNTAVLQELGTGTTFKELSTNNLKSIPFFFPPLKVQRQIVAVLDEAFEGLDRARAHTEANAEDAQELFDCCLARSLLAESEDWPTVTLPKIAQNLDRVRVPITKKDRIPGDVPYYGASGVVDYVAGFLFDEDLLLISEDGANLLARTYPIAFSISGRSWVNNHAHVLRFNNSITQEYVRLYLNSISLASYVGGMAQPKLNQAALNRIPIPFPTGTMQAEIVEKAEAIYAETDRLARAYQASVDGIDNLRNSILQRAFAGELT